MRLVFLALFIGVSVKVLHNLHLEVLAVPQTRPGGYGTSFTPYATTDAVIRELFRYRDRAPANAAAHPSEELRSALAVVPGDAEILFVGSREDLTYGLAYTTVCYLGWPRRIYELECRSDVPALRPPPSARITWAIHYNSMPPAWSPGGRQMLPLFSLVSLPEPVPWNRYCLR